MRGLHRPRLLVTPAAELPNPLQRPVQLETSDDQVAVSPVLIPWKSAERLPIHVNARPVCSHADGPIVLAGAELGRPKLMTVPVVLRQIPVHSPGIRSCSAPRVAPITNSPEAAASTSSTLSNLGVPN